MTPPEPVDRSETRRLQALRDLEVLDTPPEAVFDAIVRTAAAVCDVPIALISLVDDERQWFKANFGLDGVRQTPREVAFCDHAVRDAGLMEVPDATQDPRFRDNPLVTGAPDIRFYAGAPIDAGDGLRVGTVCVIDRSAHLLTRAQRATLVQLAEVASQALRSRLQERRASRRLTSLLDERETLLKEVYHRVKNNLQVVQSLLNMQQRNLADEACRRALADSAHRVRAMALVHEHLYRSPSLSAVDLPGYVNGLLREISAVAGDDGLRLTGEVDPATVSADAAVPLGLLLNELVSNAVEHGRQAGEALSVRVSLRQDAGQAWQLLVQDDGTGFAEAAWSAHPTSMGLTVAHGLARQLGGQLQLLSAKAPTCVGAAGLKLSAPAHGAA